MDYSFDEFMKDLRGGKQKSLLIVEFGDNDFGHAIRDGLDSLYEDVENVYNHSTDAIKEYLTAHVLCRFRKQYALWGLYLDEVSNKKYLSDMRVTFCRKLPTYEPEGELVDHNGGSAGIDLATGYSFTF